MDLTLEPGSFKAGLGLDLQQVSTAQLKSVDVRGSLDLTAKAVENLRLDLGQPGSALTVAGRVPFDSKVEPIDLKIDAFSWPLAEAKPLLPFDLPLDGPVSGHLDLQLADGKTSGSLDAHIAPGVFTLQSVPFDNLEAHLAWDDEQDALPGGRDPHRGRGGARRRQLRFRRPRSSTSGPAAPSSTSRPRRSPPSAPAPT